MSTVTYPFGEVNMESKEKSLSLSEAVRALRQALGDTQQSFAHRLGLAISTVVRYELTRPPSGAALLTFANLAEQADREDLKQIFLYEFAVENGMLKNRSGFSSRWNDENELEGFLFLALKGKEQDNAAFNFYRAFMFHFRPESYAHPPSHEARAHAATIMKSLAKWPGGKSK